MNEIRFGRFRLNPTLTTQDLEGLLDWCNKQNANAEGHQQRAAGGCGYCQDLGVIDDDTLGFPPCPHCADTIPKLFLDRTYADGVQATLDYLFEREPR